MQECLVATHRCVSLVETATHARSQIPEPVLRNAAALKALRDSYEHIDERAQGKGRNLRVETDPREIFKDATSIITEGAISFDGRTLDLTDLRSILDACREAIFALIP